MDRNKIEDTWNAEYYGLTGQKHGRTRKIDGASNYCCHATRRAPISGWWLSGGAGLDQFLVLIGLFICESWVGLHQQNLVLVVTKIQQGAGVLVDY